jgi:hypothetical protein
MRALLRGALSRMTVNRHPVQTKPAEAGYTFIKKIFVNFRVLRGQLILIGGYRWCSSSRVHSVPRSGMGYFVEKICRPPSLMLPC